jgi:hypothetical protein
MMAVDNNELPGGHLIASQAVNLIEELPLERGAVLGDTVRVWVKGLLEFGYNATPFQARRNLVARQLPEVVLKEQAEEEGDGVRRLVIARLLAVSHSMMQTRGSTCMQPGHTESNRLSYRCRARLMVMVVMTSVIE